MSDNVMRRLTGWSLAQLAAWRASLTRPEAPSRADRLRAVLPAEVVDAAIAAGEKGTGRPVGKSLIVSFDQLSPEEQSRWRAVQAKRVRSGTDYTVSLSLKSEMDGRPLSPLERSKAMRPDAAAERAWLSGICDMATARAQGRMQGRLFTDAELDESIPERLKLPARELSD